MPGHRSASANVWHSLPSTTNRVTPRTPSSCARVSLAAKACPISQQKTEAVEPQYQLTDSMSNGNVHLASEIWLPRWLGEADTNS